MLPESGTGLLIIALLACFGQWSRHAKVQEFCVWIQCFALALALAVLITLRLDHDFSVASVAAHSNRSLPALYLVVGAWGNHEGSMLLWVWILALYASSLVLSHTGPALKSLTLKIQGTLSAGFLLFILQTSNPFARLSPVPADGTDLNPLLQDIGLAMHPPLLYLGYVGFGLVFSLACAAMWLRMNPQEWARQTRSWVTFAVSMLTLGIGLGSWWAYRELGWGGFWFWDPVENASLLPWLPGIALMHSLIAIERRGVLVRWALFLAIFTFAMSLLGTFLVRSGVLISVHSFASDPARGFYILAYLACIIGGGFVLFALRAGHMQEARAPSLRSREGALVIQNLLLMLACSVVLIGTLYPIASEWLEGERVSVGPAFFNTMLLPLVLTMLPLMAALTYPALKKPLTPRKTGMICAHLGVALVAVGATLYGAMKVEVETLVEKEAEIELGGYRLYYLGERYEQRPNHTAKIGTFRVEDARRNEITTLHPEFRFYPLSGMVTSEAAIEPMLWGDLYVVIGEASLQGATAARMYINPTTHIIWLGCLLMCAGGLVTMRTRRKDRP